MAVGPVPDAARAPTCTARSSPARRRPGSGYHPYRAPTGVNSVEYDGRPGVQQLRLLRPTTAARSTPRATRSRRCATRCAPAGARCGPSRYVTDVLLDGARPPSPRRALPRPRPARPTRSRRRPRDARRRRVRDAAAAAALRARQLPDLVGRYLMYHFQTFVLGIFPFRLHGHRGRLGDPPHGRPDRARRRRAAAAARDAGLPYIRGGIVEHGGGWPPDPWRRSTCPPGPRTRRLDARLDRCATGMAAFTMQGEDLPQATNRIDLDPQRPRRVRARRGPGHVRAAPPRDRVRRSTGRRASRPSCSDAGARYTFWATSPPIAGITRRERYSPAPISRHIDGHRAHGRRPGTSVFDPWQRLPRRGQRACTDSSVFPTSTGYGPTLTIVALAIRMARELAGLPKLTSNARPGLPWVANPAQRGRATTEKEKCADLGGRLKALVAPAHTALVLQEVQNGVVGEHSVLPQLAAAAQSIDLVGHCARARHATARSAPVPLHAEIRRRHRRQPQHASLRGNPRRCDRAGHRRAGVPEAIGVAPRRRAPRATTASAR